MSISAKIALLALTFSLPIGVLVCLMVSSINANIAVARQEQIGSAFLRPLVETLQRVQDHQLASWKCTQTPTDCSTLDPLKARVEGALQNLATADARYGAELKFTPEELAKRARSQQTLANVRKQWKAIADSGSATSEGQYAHLIADLRTMITHAGDTSNLILDPDLDSYYLMDAVLVALPETQDRIARVAMESNSLLAGKGSEAERMQAAVSASQLTGDHQHVVESSQASLNEDANFYGSSPSLAPAVSPALHRYDEAAKHLEDLTRQASQGARIDPAEYQLAATTARQAAFSYWGVAVGELDKLLDARASFYQNSRTMSLMWSGLALLIAGGLAFILARTITLPLGGLMRSLGPGATLLGECVQRISEVSQSQTVDPLEAQIICGELDAHAHSMRQAVLALARQVNGAAEADMTTPVAMGRS
jgi:methyl-accepting chemotaxis protein